MFRGFTLGVGVNGRIISAVDVKVHFLIGGKTCGIAREESASGRRSGGANTPYSIGQAGYKSRR
jgi:hypothetical protein